jgi:cytochrome c-type biogenesis protein CcmH
VSRALRSWLPWGLLAIALVVVVAVGGSRDTGPKTNAERVQHIASQVRCPVCRSESVAESDATPSVSLKADIAERVQAGQTDAEILRAIQDRFPDQGILLTPPRNGINSLVWALPVVAMIAAAGGLVLAFRHWRNAAVPELAEADRDLVAAALAADDDVGEGIGR